MPEGWVRDWKEDAGVFWTTYRSRGSRAAKKAQAEFRRNFSTPLRSGADEAAEKITDLTWEDRLDLPHGLSEGAWTEASVSRNGGTVTGFVRSARIVELAHVGLAGKPRDPFDTDPFTARLRRSGKDAELLWGDPVQIIERRGDVARVRARGMTGEIDADRLAGAPLLEAYVIDVGQGDGVLVRFPDGRHMLIDGGMARDRQMTGKNAADFVDWKFFEDYGSWRVTLDWMIASHSDADHYGGLRDLVDKDEVAADELDCLEVRVGAFGHPGLSRFPGSVHGDRLGPRVSASPRPLFTRLLDDREDAESLVPGSGAPGPKLGGEWADFIEAILRNDPGTEFRRLSLDIDDAAAGALPDIAAPGAAYAVRVLGPVTVEHDGAPALPDLGETSINTNGHSVCLRIDHGAARLLLAGDLNTASMKWLSDCYGDAIGAWESDVAKACHHGSHDVSFRFLEAIRASATVISSGDNEGYAHPRPEIVAASALSGHRELSADGERVVTPLIYMTEVERSALLAEINRVEIVNLAEAGDRAVVLGKTVGRFSDREFLSDADWDALGAITEDADEDRLVREAVRRERERLGQAADAALPLGTRATAYGRRPTGVVGTAYPRKSVRGLRMMEANVYGLVNVRTDGRWIMCASKRDTGAHWTIHWFRARFA